MTYPTNLPRLDLADTISPFDEAAITIDGREEETITVACEGARELAEQIIELARVARALQGLTQRSEA